MRESVALMVIGIADLVTTLIWVHKSGAIEANPIFSSYLQLGDGWFVASKLLMLICPVFLIEWAHLSRPNFAQMGARFAVLGYIVVYCVGVSGLNHSASAQQRIKAPVPRHEYVLRTRAYNAYNSAYFASHGHMPQSRPPDAFNEYVIED